MGGLEEAGCSGIFHRYTYFFTLPRAPHSWLPALLLCLQEASFTLTVGSTAPVKVRLHNDGTLGQVRSSLQGVLLTLSITLTLTPSVFYSILSLRGAHPT